LRRVAAILYCIFYFFMNFTTVDFASFRNCSFGKWRKKNVYKNSQATKIPLYNGNYLTAQSTLFIAIIFIQSFHQSNGFQQLCHRVLAWLFGPRPHCFFATHYGRLQSVVSMLTHLPTPPMSLPSVEHTYILIFLQTLCAILQSQVAAKNDEIPN